MRLARNTRLFTLALLAVVMVIALAVTVPLAKQEAYAATNYTALAERDGGPLELADGSDAAGKAMFVIDVVYPEEEQTAYTVWSDEVTIRVSIVNDSGMSYEYVGYTLYYNVDVFGEPYYSYTNSNFSSSDFGVAHSDSCIKAAMQANSVIADKELVLFEATFPVSEECTLVEGDRVPFYFDDPTGNGDTMVLGTYDDPEITCKELEIEFIAVTTGLSELTVDGQDMQSKGFTPNVSLREQEITLEDVEFNKSTLEIAATAVNPEARVEGLGTRELAVGDNDVEVVVYSQGQHSTYTIKIKRLPNTVAQLAKLELLDGETDFMAGEFAAGKYEYELNVPFATTSLKYVVEAIETAEYVIAANDSIDSEECVWSLELGDGNEMSIEVTAQDGVSKNTYTIKINRGDASANNRLSSLSVLYDDETDLLVGENAFSPDKTEYTVVMPYRVQSLKVVAVAEDHTAIISGDVDVVEFATGTSKELEIRVTPENGGASKVYKVVVNRTPVSTDARLSSLTVDGYGFTSAFDSETLVYSLMESVAALTTTLKVNAVASFSEATIVIDNDATIEDGIVSLRDGEGVIRIVVTAEDGINFREYRINYYKIAASTDATLKALSVEGQELTPAFDRYTYNYTLQPVGSEVETLRIVAEAFDEAATVEGAGEVSLHDGTNEIEIVVTAQSGAVRKYVISVIRSGVADPNALLQSLSIQDADGNELLNGFDANRLTYTLTVANEVDYVKIAAQSEHSVKLDNVSPSLVEGVNNIYITVNGKDGAVNVYIISIVRSAPLDKNALLSGLTVSGYEISPVFFEGIFTYRVTVGYEVSSVTVTAIAKSPAVLGKELGSVGLVVGENEIEIEVVAQAGNVNVYRLIVTRSPLATQTTDKFTATLKGASEAQGKADAQGNYEFTIGAGTGMWTLEIVADGDSAVAQINGVGSHRTATLAVSTEYLMLYPSVNEYRITITPAQGEAKVYVVRILVETAVVRIELPTAVASGEEQVLQIKGEADLTEESLQSLVITVVYAGGSVTGKASELGAKVEADVESKVIKVSLGGASVECGYEIVRTGGNSTGLIVTLILFIILFVSAAFLMVLFFLQWKKATQEVESAATEAKSGSERKSKSVKKSSSAKKSSSKKKSSKKKSSHKKK